jgi:hypothetical protein
MTLPSLYDQNPAAWDMHAAQGAIAMRDVAKLFSKCSLMDRALGFSNAAAHWHSGRNNVSRQSERLAAAWLARNPEPQSQPAPVAAKPDTALMLVSCPPAMVDRARKMLAFLGCEVVDV